MHKYIDSDTLEKTVLPFYPLLLFSNVDVALCCTEIRLYQPQTSQVICFDLRKNWLCLLREQNCEKKSTNRRYNKHIWTGGNQNKGRFCQIMAEIMMIWDPGVCLTGESKFRDNKTQRQLCKRLAGPIIPLYWSCLVWKRVSLWMWSLGGRQQPFSCV